MISHRLRVPHGSACRPGAGLCSVRPVRTVHVHHLSVHEMHRRMHEHRPDCAGDRGALHRVLCRRHRLLLRHCSLQWGLQHPEHDRGGHQPRSKRTRKHLRQCRRLEPGESC